MGKTSKEELLVGVALKIVIILKICVSTVAVMGWREDAFMCGPWTLGHVNVGLKHICGSCKVAILGLFTCVSGTP